jgi:ABC-type glycerol-3-phosphate transport system substrate-binding protein
MLKISTSPLRLEKNYGGREMKKVLIVVLVALTLLSLVGCPSKGTGKLVIWSFTDELANMTNNPTWGFKATHPGIDVEYSQTPSDQFQAKIDPVLATGQGAPDIIALESAFVRKYVESGLLLDISDIYESKKSSLLAYPAEIGTYNGKVYGLSWQACPGALFYRRSLAKKYFGTDDPKTVQGYFADFNKFLETAQLLKQKSNNACVVVSSLGDLRNSFLSARKDSWLVNGKVVIDPAMEQYLDIGKTLHDNRWEGRVGQWSEGWFAGMKGELKDESGRAVEVFSYFLPTWGLHYVLKTNAPGTSGDWAMIQGPSAYRWGGTWVGAYKGTKNKENAKEFIRYVATDESFLEAWAKETGDMVNNLNVVNKIKDTYSEPYLGGQNHYAEFAEMAKAVNGKLLQGTDEAIEAMFDEAAAAFWNGEKTKAQALADFRSQAEAQFGK